MQALVAASVFFVWVVRYANIVQEFEQYGLPDWLLPALTLLLLSTIIVLINSRLLPEELCCEPEVS